MKHVIGLGGHKESGKDAIADYLVEHHGFVKLGMSDPLHDAMMRLNPLVGIGVRMVEEQSSRLGFSRIKETREVRYADIIAERGYVEAKKEPEVRTLLQKFGTDVVRDLIGVDTWVNIATRRIQALVDQGTPVVMTALRFQNELSMFERWDSKTLWVDRPGKTGDGHASENSVQPGDFELQILNDGTLEDLYAKVRSSLVSPPLAIAPSNGAAVGPVGRQQVLVDGFALMTLTGDNPQDPTKAIVESFLTGPMVIDKRRLQAIA